MYRATSFKDKTDPCFYYKTYVLYIWSDIQEPVTSAIKKILTGIMPLENNHIELFVSKFKQVSYVKGDYFIREGQVSRFLGFISKGCLMCTYNTDGKEFIDEFSMDNDFITDYASFVTGAPADKNVVFLEDSDLLILGHHNLQELYETDPVFERAGRMMAEMLFINWQQRAKSLLIEDAETRYNRLLENRPELVQRVPQYLLAEYLRITPETLSRIRKKISIQ
jgi:CRP-like cAMP-binding protein